MPDQEVFSVWQFYVDGSNEKILDWTDAETAVKKARSLTETVAARSGFVHQIIITDTGDRTVFEWQHGKGVTFPKITDLNIN